jgi:hypothetical protein
VRLSFLFALLAAPDPFTLAAGFTPVFDGFLFLSIDAEALPAFCVTAVDAARVSAAPSFCFSLVSFFSPFCRRASSRRIFFWRLLNFFIWDEGSLHGTLIGILTKRRDNHEGSPMSRQFLALIPAVSGRIEPDNGQMKFRGQKSKAQTRRTAANERSPAGHLFSDL